MSSPTSSDSQSLNSDSSSTDSSSTDSSSTDSSSTGSSSTYVCRQKWDDSRPHVLVVSCSDGRLQENIDEFLSARGIRHYDRLFVPGGPGALASSGFELVRVDQIRRETRFLIEAHRIESVYLIFHGAAPDGPAIACCADYQRKLPGKTPWEINQAQMDDVTELKRFLAWPTHLQVFPFRAEVGADDLVRFVPLGT